jgi:rhodanese-related sulfurtransferase
VRSLLTGVGGWKQAELPLVTEPGKALTGGAAPAVNAELLALLDGYISAIPKGYNVIKPADLSVALTESKLFVVDVRGEGEWGNGRIEGATHIPLRDLAARMGELPTDKAASIVVYDNPTHRSSIAMVILGVKGYTNVKVLAGGFGAWQKANLPVVK